jgi:carbonic anhydrase
VIGVLANASTDKNPANKELNPLIKILQKATPPTKTLGLCTLDIYKILPDDKLTYRYSGSLTTPPYTEGVEWNVIREHINTSQELIDKIIAFTEPNTAREIQETKVPVIFDEKADMPTVTSITSKPMIARKITPQTSIVAAAA